MLKEDMQYLNSLTRNLIEIEVALINNRFETAYYLMKRLNKGSLDDFLCTMQGNLRDKLFEIHAEK